MTNGERDAIGALDARLFGLDGSGSGGAFGELNDRLTRVESRLDRWDGAITLVKAAAGILGFSGLALILRAIVVP